MYLNADTILLFINSEVFDDIKALISARLPVLAQNDVSGRKCCLYCVDLLLLMTNMKSRMGFRLAPRSMILDDLELL